MGLARAEAGFGLGALLSLRSQLDFDAPGLSARERLVRLEYAAAQAARCCTDEATRQELAFTLEECRDLLSMDSLEGEAAEAARVGQRMERIRRVVLHYEGQLSRLNRQYWWIPFGLGVLALGWCVLGCFLAL